MGSSGVASSMKVLSSWWTVSRHLTMEVREVLEKYGTFGGTLTSDNRVRSHMLISPVSHTTMRRIVHRLSSKNWRYKEINLSNRNLRLVSVEDIVSVLPFGSVTGIR